MPTFTTIALERLLEPNLDRNTSSFRLKQQINTNNNNNNTINNTKKPPKHIFISPALYTTPEPAPIPYTSTDSVSPSPYVVNRKRRDLRVPEAVNRLDGFEIRQLPKEEDDLGGNGDSSSLANPIEDGEESCNVSTSFLEKEVCSDESLSGVEIVLGEREGLVGNDLVERDESSPSGFFVPGDSMSVTSCSEVDGSRHAYGKSSQISTQTEFFDADEEFFSDGSMSNATSPSPITSIMELRASRVKLFEEIERRKRADETVAQMQNQWQRVTKHLSEVGLSFPAALDAGYDTQVEQFCQEVIVARFVSDVIGRGLARAEIEEAAEALIESKHLEISRLRDKLQYYETVNHEMFQRNQEVVELARTQRNRRKTKQRWIWSCIGLSITLGASVLAYSYLPEMSTHSSMNSTDAPDVPPGPTESTFIGG